MNNDKNSDLQGYNMKQKNVHTTLHLNFPHHEHSYNVKLTKSNKRNSAFSL